MVRALGIRSVQIASSYKIVSDLPVGQAAVVHQTHNHRFLGNSYVPFFLRQLGTSNRWCILSAGDGGAADGL